MKVLLGLGVLFVLEVERAHNQVHLHVKADILDVLVHKQLRMRRLIVL